MAITQFPAPMIIGGPRPKGWDSGMGTSQSIAFMQGTGDGGYYMGPMFWEDGGTHTVDTSGSSLIRLAFLSATTFVNGGTALRIGIADVDASGTTNVAAQPVNTSGLTDFDVYRSLTGGGGGLTTDAVNSFVPNAGSKTIAHGDYIAIGAQMRTRGGSDSIRTVNLSNGSYNGPVIRQSGLSTWLSLTGYAAAMVRASDGTWGWILGTAPLTWRDTFGIVSFSSATSPNERGNRFQFPMDVEITGIQINDKQSSGNRDYDVVLYTDPLGTPVAQRTYSVDASKITQFAGKVSVDFAPYTLAANTPCVAAIKPTTTNSSLFSWISATQADDFRPASLGIDCYAAYRNAGGGAFTMNTLQMHGISLVLSGMDVGGGGGGGGLLSHPGMRGGMI